MKRHRRSLHVGVAFVENCRVQINNTVRRGKSRHSLAAQLGHGAYNNNTTMSKQKYIEELANAKLLEVIATNAFMASELRVVAGRHYTRFEDIQSEVEKV